jgi:6-pyruvoyltetrahydropterin/6-carboxytetrahydropterin synthase
MFEISVEEDFSAAHRLKEYSGNCEHLHGHNWRVQATFRASQLDSLGLAFDFRTARKMLHSTISVYDHKYLNELALFESSNPSCEMLARQIFLAIGKALADSSVPGVRLAKVTLWESDHAFVSYFEESSGND